MGCWPKTRSDLVWNDRHLSRRETRGRMGELEHNEITEQSNIQSAVLFMTVLWSPWRPGFPRPMAMGSSGIILTGAHQSRESRVCSASTPPCSLHTTSGETGFLSITLTLFQCSAVHGQTPDEATWYPSVIRAINYLTTFSFLPMYSSLPFFSVKLVWLKREKGIANKASKKLQNDSNLAKTATCSHV